MVILHFFPPVVLPGIRYCAAPGLMGILPQAAANKPRRIGRITNNRENSMLRRIALSGSCAALLLGAAVPAHATDVELGAA